MKIGDKLDIYSLNYPKVEGNIRKVSVIIPNYNYEDYIIERIDSILRQTYPIHEIVILDDKSSDNSVKIIKNKIKECGDINIKLIVNDKNSGCVFRQWEKGIENITGDYFWIAEADDSSDPRFLEEAMSCWDKDSNVVLSYVESCRMDENNVITRLDSKDLYNIFDSNHWDKSFIVEGSSEIRKYLSSVNTILNVSSIVWKKDDYKDILDKAVEFKVAGDWYIYTKVLERGNLAFSNKAYNYFRKHSKSVSTTVKDDIEYLEICRIQDEVADKFDLTMEEVFNQRRRRNFMDKKVSKKVRKKRIAWVIPHPGKGSGGHRTIIQNINALAKAGYESDIYVEEDYISTDKIVKNKIDSYYGYCAANVYVGTVLRDEYDLIFATGWTTIDFVKNMKCDKKAYFIQDYEPWFLPMGDAYINTENSYRLGFSPITIGKWLSHKMINEYGLSSQYFDFCADLNVYKKLKDVEKEDAICYIFQPEKPRRCDRLGLSALKIVKEMRPNTKIYLYGSDTKQEPGFEAEKLGIIPIEECNKLYNKCKLGFCISASNPSRIPFEMMAAGLPVVEIYKENNLYDFPEGGIVLAEPSPEAVATAILDLLDNEKELKKMSKIGIDYMKDYPLEKGYEQFVEAVDNLFNCDKIKKQDIKPSYTKEAIKASDKVRKKALEIQDNPNIIAGGGENRRKLRRGKKKVKNVVQSGCYKIINFVERI